MITNHMHIAMQNIAFEAQRLQSIAQMLQSSSASTNLQAPKDVSAPQETANHQTLSSKGSIISIRV